MSLLGVFSTQLSTVEDSHLDDFLNALDDLPIDPELASIFNDFENAKSEIQSETPSPLSKTSTPEEQSTNLMAELEALLYDPTETLKDDPNFTEYLKNIIDVPTTEINTQTTQLENFAINEQEVQAFARELETALLEEQTVNQVDKEIDFNPATTLIHSSLAPVSSRKRKHKDDLSIDMREYETALQLPDERQAKVNARNKMKYCV